MTASLSIHLDWVRYTVPYNPDLQEQTNLHLAKPNLPIFDFTGESIDIGQGFNQGRRLNAGAIFWHDHNPKQGISVQLAGLDLQELRHTLYTEPDLLRFIDERKARMSTLHSCINVKNAGANPIDVLEAFRTGIATGRAKHIGQYSGSDKVKGQWLPSDTVYIGSPKSAIQVRIYNKAAEQKESGDWIRVEIVWRGRHARAAHAAMLRDGIDAVTRGAIRRQVTFSCAWWDYAMHGDTSLPDTVRKNAGGRNLWLRNVVLPSLAREIDEQRKHGSDEIYELYAGFIDRMKPIQNIDK